MFKKISKGISALVLSATLSGTSVTWADSSATKDNATPYDVTCFSGINAGGNMFKTCIVEVGDLTDYTIKTEEEDTVETTFINKWYFRILQLLDKLYPLANLLERSIID